jgi:hypothetical protein
LKLLIRNETRKTVLATAAEVADTSAKRRQGLLKHKSLAAGQGLWIAPCEAVHSFFMKFPIDVIYLDRKKRVRKVTRNLAPWRLSACLTAHSVLELPAGKADETQTQPGDLLIFEQV